MTTTFQIAVAHGKQANAIHELRRILHRVGSENSLRALYFRRNGTNVDIFLSTTEDYPKNKAAAICGLISRKHGRGSAHL